MHMGVGRRRGGARGAHALLAGMDWDDATVNRLRALGNSSLCGCRGSAVNHHDYHSLDEIRLSLVQLLM